MQTRNVLNIKSLSSIKCMKISTVFYTKLTELSLVSKSKLNFTWQIKNKINKSIVVILQNDLFLCTNCYNRRKGWLSPISNTISLSLIDLTIEYLILNTQ